MKKQYRIVQQVITNGLEEVIKNEYFIKKKTFLFWWVNTSIKCGYIYYNTIEGRMGVMLINKVITFHTEKDAYEYLDKYLVNPFKEIYKGNKIISVPHTKSCTEIFINKSNSRDIYDGRRGYEYCDFLEELKQLIDMRIKKTKQYVVNSYEKSN